MFDKTRLLITGADLKYRVDASIRTACFEQWQEIWQQTFFELGVAAKLDELSFSSHDFLAVLLTDERIRGFCLFRSVDVKKKDDMSNAWFNPWPSSLLTQIMRIYRRGLVPSYLTVTSEYRRSNRRDGLRTTDLMCEMMHQIAIDLGSDICFGTPRRDRSVHKAMISAGAVVLREAVVHFGVEIDLVAFFPKDAAKTKFSDFANSLWASRTDHRKLIASTQKEGSNDLLTL